MSDASPTGPNCGLSLAGRTALVTGASRGIGRATVLALAAAGTRTVAHYGRSEAAAAAVLAEAARLGPPPIAIAADVRREEEVERLMASAVDALGAIDLVVANAGIWTGAAIDEMPASLWHETIATNLDSIFYTARAAARHMKPRASGSIILIGSTAGQRGEAFHAHYAATKGAVIAFTRSLASELGPHGIRVNCVAPGWVDTDMSRAAIEGGDRERILDQIPLRRVALPEDIAGPILFLASPLARHITGHVLSVNGGSVMA